MQFSSVNPRRFNGINSDVTPPQVEKGIKKQVEQKTFLSAMKLTEIDLINALQILTFLIREQCVESCFR
jgi:hypothetical protein